MVADADAFAVVDTGETERRPRYIAREMAEDLEHPLGRGGLDTVRREMRQTRGLAVRTVIQPGELGDHEGGVAGP